MSRSGVRCCGLVAAVLMLFAVSTAHAADVTGGMAAVDRPEVKALECAASSGASCAPGEVLELTGAGLDGADAVVFLGARGRRDDRRATPSKRRFHVLSVRVPRGARSGPVQVTGRRLGRSRPSAPVEVVASASARAAAPTQAPSTTGEGTFPVAGKHDYGTAVNGFGGGRDHKGQDVFAACGTPIVAALGGVVSHVAFQSRAGNYAVITAEDGTSQAYMHMRRPASVEKGARVTAGQRIGEVGDTGRASGCHLHFEFWTAPGWYEGGRPIDPAPRLRGWDA